MTSAVDSNILLDLVVPGSPDEAGSRRRLEHFGNRGTLIICEAVHAEVSARFPDRPLLDDYLDALGVQLRRSSRDALTGAGAAWRAYTANRPTGISCAACGRMNTPTCEGCSSALRTRQHVLADFLVGAHAATHADRLITRDLGYYKTYFPQLELA